MTPNAETPAPGWLDRKLPERPLLRDGVVVALPLVPTAAALAAGAARLGASAPLAVLIGVLAGAAVTGAWLAAVERRAQRRGETLFRSVGEDPLGGE